VVVRLGIRVGVSEKAASEGRPENGRSWESPNGLELTGALAGKPRSSVYDRLEVFRLSVAEAANAWRSAGEGLLVW